MRDDSNHFRVLFEDPNLIVLSKAAGLLSQGEKTGDENLVDLLRVRFGRPYVGLVHRLDRNTSGLLVVAKRTKAAQRLTQALQSGQLIRKYQAWVLGGIRAPARWEDLLYKDEKTNLTRVISPGDRLASQAKRAVLQARPLARGIWNETELTLVEIELETGRSHQIRVQAAHHKHPLLGDLKYGGPSSELRFGRPALHSSYLSFPHPISKEILSFEDPLPPDLARIPRTPIA